VRKLSEMLQVYCFPAGTLVATESGHKPIEQIKVGDLVWAQSDKTGKVDLRRVEHLFGQ